MNQYEEPPFASEEAQVPPEVQTVVGLVLAAFSLLCLAGSVSMILLPGKTAPVLTQGLGMVLVLVSLWGLVISFRLVIGKTVQGGLMGPGTLRTVAWVFLLLPLGGLFTGYFLTHTVQAIVQTVGYISVFFGLRSLAARRERSDV